MKILKGNLKNKSIYFNKKSNIRPTSNKAREAIFHILRDLDGEVLDLFAGSGALSFEALSNNFQKAVLIEKDRDTFKDIGKSIASLGLEDRCSIYLNRAEIAVRVLKRDGRKFSAIFVDPPYFYNNYEKLLRDIYDLMLPNGRIVLEISQKIALPKSNLCVENELKFGASKIYILRRCYEQEDEI